MQNLSQILLLFRVHSQQHAALVRTLSLALEWSSPEVLTIWLANLAHWLPLG
jgi:hypothetical protein